jgi:hypothetical protein
MTQLQLVESIVFFGSLGSESNCPTPRQVCYSIGVGSFESNADLKG